MEQKCDARQVWQISSHVGLLTTEEKRGFMGGGSNYLVHKTIKTHPFPDGEYCEINNIQKNPKTGVCN